LETIEKAEALAGLSLKTLLVTAIGILLEYLGAALFTK